jgi:hypothetical protein
VIGRNPIRRARPAAVSLAGMSTADPTPASPAGAQVPRITVIGKPGCHLCDVAKVVVQRVAVDTGAGWHERSILDDPGLAEQYWELIPVILVDGEQHAVHRVDEDQLRAALRDRPPRRWRRG